MLNLLSARESGTDNPSYLYRAETTRRTYSLELSKYQDVQKIHSGGVNTLDIDPVEHRYLLSGSADGMIVIHDLHNISGSPQYTCPSVCMIGNSNRWRHKFSVETVQWYPADTGMFVSSGMDKLLKIWDANSLKTADEYEFHDNVYNHHLSTIATQHCLVAVGTRSAKVKLIDLKSGSNTHILKGHKYPVLTVRWSTRDEFILASGSEDGHVMIWDVRSSKGALMILDQFNGETTAGANSVQTAHDGHVNGMCFTADGLGLVTFGTDNYLRLWTTSNGRNTLVNYGKIRNASRKCVKIGLSQDCVSDVVYVPHANNIECYDVWNGGNISTLRGHYNQVNCCMLQPYTQEMYSGGNDRNILIWVPDTGPMEAYEEGMRGDRTEGSTTRTSLLKRVGVGDTWSDSDDD